MCQRGFDAVDRYLTQLKLTDRKFAAELPSSAAGLDDEKPAMTYAILPDGRNYRKILKVSALVSFGVIMFLLVRKKALEAEQLRLQEFIAAEMQVKTQFVDAGT